jgi:cytochrome c5
MSNDHGSLIKTPKQLIIMVFIGFFVPLMIILLLMVYVENSKQTDGDAKEAAAAANQLIKPVAQLEFRDANAPREMKTGAAVYKSACASCHDNGAAGAPRFNNAGDWSGRLGKGYDALLTSVIKGKGAMPARGGSNPADINDHELGLSVVYLTGSSGGKFPEPKAPAAAPAQAASK